MLFFVVALNKKTLQWTRQCNKYKHQQLTFKVLGSLALYVKVIGILWSGVVFFNRIETLSMQGQKITTFWLHSERFSVKAPSS